MFSNHYNVPAQFRHDLRQEFFTRPFCCHLVRVRLQLLFKALLNDQAHFLCLASFAQVNTLLHAAVILVGSLSTPHAKNKTSGSLLYENVIIGFLSSMVGCLWELTTCIYVTTSRLNGSSNAPISAIAWWGVVTPPPSCPGTSTTGLAASSIWAPVAPSSVYCLWNKYKEINSKLLSK